MSEDREIDHEYTDHPVCPWCGHEITDGMDIGEMGLYSEDGSNWECPECGESVRSECDISYNFTTSKRDPEAEKAKREKEILRRKEQDAQRCREAAPFTPGTRIRVSENSIMKFYLGQTGVVANKEMTPSGFVYVILDREDGKIFETHFSGKDLEKM